MFCRPRYHIDGAALTCQLINAVVLLAAVVDSDNALIDGIHVSFPARSCSRPYSVISKSKQDLFEGHGNGSLLYGDRNRPQQAFHFTDRLIIFSKQNMSNVMKFDATFAALFNPAFLKFLYAKNRILPTKIQLPPGKLQYPQESHV